MKSEAEVQRYLSHIEISGFRNLKDVKVDLSPLTVLIGANGAGKSNFIRFFDLITWVKRGGDLGEWVIREGGADDQLFMGARVSNEIRGSVTIAAYDSDEICIYDFGMHVASPDTLYIQNERYRLKNSKRASDPEDDLPYPEKHEVLFVSNFLDGCRVYQFHDTSKHAAIKKLQDTSNNILLNSDGGNLAPILLNLSENEPKRLKLIEKQISRLLPTFDRFVLEPQHGKVMLRWRHKQGDKVMGAHLTSDGSLRLFSLITLLNLPSDMLPDVILLDEPELGLHPSAITLVAAMIERVAERHQIILATQSPFMVNCFELDNLVVADQEGGATRLRKLNKEQYQDWLDDDFSVSELWLSNVLGGQP